MPRDLENLKYEIPKRLKQPSASSAQFVHNVGQDPSTGYNLFATRFNQILWCLSRAGLADYELQACGALWSLSKGNRIHEGAPFLSLKESANLSLAVVLGKIASKDRQHAHSIVYIDKRWNLHRTNWREPYNELAMYMHPRYLLSLQGDVILRVLDVSFSSDHLNISLQVPDPLLWYTATHDLSHEMKGRIVGAYQRIHARGVLHGSVALHNILVSDSRIVIVDFSRSRAIVPNDVVHLTTEAELYLEAENVKALLAYTVAVEDRCQRFPEHCASARWNGQESNDLPQAATGEEDSRYVMPQRDKFNSPILQHIHRDWVGKFRARRLRRARDICRTLHLGALATDRRQNRIMAIAHEAILLPIHGATRSSALFSPTSNIHHYYHNPADSTESMASIVAPTPQPQYLSPHDISAARNGKSFTVQNRSAVSVHNGNNKFPVALPFSRPMRPSPIERQKPDMPPPSTLPGRLIKQTQLASTSGGQRAGSKSLSSVNDGASTVPIARSTSSRPILTRTTSAASAITLPSLLPATSSRLSPRISSSSGYASSQSEKIAYSAALQDFQASSSQSSSTPNEKAGRVDANAAAVALINLAPRHNAAGCNSNHINRPSSFVSSSTKLSPTVIKRSPSSPPSLLVAPAEVSSQEAGASTRYNGLRTPHRSHGEKRARVDPSVIKRVQEQRKRRRVAFDDGLPPIRPRKVWFEDQLKEEMNDVEVKEVADHDTFYKTYRLDREVPKCFRCKKNRCVHSRPVHNTGIHAQQALDLREMTDAEEEIEVDAMLQTQVDFQAGVRRSAWFWSLFTLGGFW